MNIRPAETSAILKEQIASFGTEAEIAEVSRVLSVGDSRQNGETPSPGFQVDLPATTTSCSKWRGTQVTRRIFGGGSAEVNERGCIMVAEEALPFEEMDLEQARHRLKDAQDDLGEANEADRARFEGGIGIADAQIQVAGG
jgi:hypothetical protein